jgi:hypothetical protein
MSCAVRGRQLQAWQLQGMESEGEAVREREGAAQRYVQLGASGSCATEPRWAAPHHTARAAQPRPA